MNLRHDLDGLQSTLLALRSIEDLTLAGADDSDSMSIVSINCFTSLLGLVLDKADNHLQAIEQAYQLHSQTL